VITISGMGIVSPYGVGTDPFRKGMFSGQGLNNTALFDLKQFGFGEAGVVRDFVPKEHIPAMKARRMSRFSQLALIASREAWKTSGLVVEEGKEERYAVIVGTGLGSVSSTDSFFEGLVVRGPDETNPMIFPETVQNIAAAHISMELGIQGPNTTFSQGDIAGEYALHFASQLILDGIADAVLVCGVDEMSEPLLKGMKALRLLSRTGRLSPFDSRRDGVIPAEGAAALVLERAEQVEKRQGKILGAIKACGFSSDLVDRMSYSGPGVMKAAMNDALEDAGKEPDFISASANSSKGLDGQEAHALKDLFKNRVPISSLKSMTGSYMASGVLKVASALLSFQEGKVPPIYGLVDPEVAGLEYISGAPISGQFNSCLINGFSHGGSNISVYLEGPSVLTRGDL